MEPIYLLETLDFVLAASFLETGSRALDAEGTVTLV